MVKLTIDHRNVEVPDGSTVLDAARKLGIDIPTLCHREGCEPETACMVCVVRIRAGGHLLPACATPATEGMEVESESEFVQSARRTAFELILSDHAGDCLAPCQNICPAHMDVPLMMRQIAAGEFADALVTVKRDIPLPAVLGHICPAPCEGGCRRNPADAPVSVCLLKRFVADEDLATGEPYLPETAADTGRRIAIVGAGPAGLSAAYYLRLLGHGAVIYDAHEEPGGMMRYGIPDDVLPRPTLAGEIEIIRRLGVEFRMQHRLGEDMTLPQLREQYDAVLLAIGEVNEEHPAPRGVRISRDLSTNMAGVFAAGSAVRRTKLAIRSVADGKLAALRIDRFLRGGDGDVADRPFTVQMGRLDEDELAEFMLHASERQRLTPEGGLGRGFTADEAIAESARCLQCSCDCAGTCGIRAYAARYGAAPNRYRGSRRRFERRHREAGVVYEPGKCIACGLCVQITRKAAEPLGLTFVGRGFETRLAVPFDGSIAEGLGRVAVECVEACPTGALSFDRDAGPHAVTLTTSAANNRVDRMAARPDDFPGG